MTRGAASPPASGNHRPCVDLHKALAKARKSSRFIGPEEQVVNIPYEETLDVGT